MRRRASGLRLLASAVILLATWLTACAPGATPTPDPASDLASAVAVIGIATAVGDSTATAVALQTAAVRPQVPATVVPEEQLRTAVAVIQTATAEAGSARGRLATTSSATTTSTAPTGKGAAVERPAPTALPGGQRLVVQLGQKGSATLSQIVWSPTGVDIAAACSDGVHLYSLGKGSDTRLDDIGVGVTSVAYTADGYILASGHASGDISLWDFRANRGRIVSVAHSKVNGLAFVPGMDASRLVLASVGEEGVLALRFLPAQSDPDDPPHQGNRSTPKPDTTASKRTAVAASSSGNMVASALADGSIELLDLAPRSRNPVLGMRSLQGHTDEVSSLAFAPGSAIIASGSRDRSVRVRHADVPTKTIHTLTGHADVVSSVTYSPDGKTIVSGSWDKTARLWDAATGELLRTIGDHTRPSTTSGAMTC